MQGQEGADCGARTAETMPTDACPFFYECPGCGEILRPKPRERTGGGRSRPQPVLLQIAEQRVSLDAVS